MKKRTPARGPTRVRGGVVARRRKVVDSLGSEIIDIHDVAEYLHCDEGTIYRLIKEDEFPAFKLRHNLRFRRSEVEKWIAERRGKAGNGRRAR